MPNPYKSPYAERGIKAHESVFPKKKKDKVRGGIWGPERFGAMGHKWTNEYNSIQLAHNGVRTSCKKCKLFYFQGFDQKCRGGGR